MNHTRFIVMTTLTINGNIRSLYCKMLWKTLSLQSKDNHEMITKRQRTYIHYCNIL